MIYDMGIVIPSLDDNQFGIQVANAYIATSRHPIILNPDPSGAYRLHTMCDIWVSHEARQQNKNPFDARPVDVTIGDLTSSNVYSVAFGALYSIVYDQLKRLYPDYIDEQPDVNPDVSTQDAEANVSTQDANVSTQDAQANVSTQDAQANASTQDAQANASIQDANVLNDHVPSKRTNASTLDAQANASTQDAQANASTQGANVSTDVSTA